MVMYWIVATAIAVITLFPSAKSQIPSVCADETNLRSMRCCPDNCGSAEGRGMCVQVGNNIRRDMSLVRSNWPHYFSEVCNCSGNYGGFDCSRCKYGYYGDDCSMTQVLPRRNILSFNRDEWTRYQQILILSRNHSSGYKVVLSESNPGTTNIPAVDVSLYQLFVWIHHYVARDNLPDVMGYEDYAHEATGFPTWHRQYLLWLEWELQYMLKSMDDPNYHEFRLSYWDWTSSTTRINVFTASRLGEKSGISRVRGALFEDGWNTTCWYEGSNNRMRPPLRICDPTTDTGPLQRCPTVNGVDYCRENDLWPTSKDVEDALNKQHYDTDPFDKSTTGSSFRNFMEGFQSGCDNTRPQLCQNGVQRYLHNAVHIIVGLGHFEANLDNDKKGVMADVAASPNDPVFINHHTMIDCILEEWLRRHPDAQYPSGVSTQGHRSSDYIVPFFPLFMHNQVFTQAENFGYRCDISFPSAATPSVAPPRPPSRSAASPAVQPLQWSMFTVFCLFGVTFS